VEAPSRATTLGITAWPMFRHDLLHTGRSSYLGAQTYSVKWTFAAGGIESTPAIDANGNIYVQSIDGYLYSLYSNGTLRWKYHTFDSYVGCCVAPESSPAIDSNSVVYVGSADGNLYSVFSNGTLNWRFATGGPIQSSPAIGNDGTIYVGSYDGNLYAITQNGLLKWKFATGGAVVSSPAIDSRGVIYVGSNDTRLYAVYPSGRLQWAFKTGGGIFSSPSIGVGGIVYVASRDGYLYAVDRGGNLVWNFLISPNCQPALYQSDCPNDDSPAIGPKGTIYIGAGAGSFGFYAFNRDGTLLWRYGLAEIRSSAAIGSDGTIYMGVDDPFYAFNPNGTVKWVASRQEVGYIVYSSPSIAPDGTILIGASGGVLAIS
jgi:outer membrane protein assembly factor BamB